MGANSAGENNLGHQESEVDLDSAWIRMRRRIVSIPVGLYLGFQLLYGVNVMRCYPLVGDAADYASLIAHGVFSVRTTHVGFYVLYYPFYCFARLAGIEYDIVANLATSILAATGVAFLYIFLRETISGDTRRRTRLALTGASLYGLSGLIWYHAEFAEVQAAMMLFLFVALVAFVRGRYLLAGVLLGASALVSQACAPAGLWFLVLAFLRRIGLRNFLRFAGSFALTLGACVLPIIHDFLYGPRGLLPSTEYYQQASITKTVLSLGYSLVESFWPLLPALILAMAILRRERELWWIAIVSVPGFMILGCRLCQVEYGFIWMPVYVIVATMAAIGLEAILVRLRPLTRSLVTVAVVVSFGATTYFSYLMPKQREAAHANTCITEIFRLVQEGDYLVTQPHVGFVYAHQRWPDWPDVTTAGNWSMTAQTTLKLVSDPYDVDRIYVLDYVPPSHFLRRILFDNSLAKAWLPHERRQQFLRELEPISEEVLSLDSSLNMDLVFECGGTRLWLVEG